MNRLEAARREYHRFGRALTGRLRKLRDDSRGSIALVFGLSLSAIVIAGGGGIDLSRAYQARQQLSQVATLACQYASRPSVIQMTAANYSAAVKTYINQALAAQHFNWTQTNGAPFTFTANGPADVNLSANVPTAFMKVINVTQLPVSAVSHCYDTPSTIPQIVANGNAKFVLKESFEATATSGVAYLAIPGSPQSTPTTGFSSSPVYTGSDGAQWYGTGYCLETDPVGVISSTVADGVRSAELDCDNGTGAAGNSAISTKVYLPVGNYELRYNYRSRVQYPNYDPTYICASAAADLSWANDTRAVGGPVTNALRTNQMNVYLDQNISGSPPLHYTMDGTQQLAGSNLIDMCVYSYAWIERSVRVYVTAANYYWLSFAADGQNDSFGAQLDNVRLCQDTCAGSVQDNFPASWLSNKLLFEDYFSLPLYVQDPFVSAPVTKGGNLANSYGTSGSVLLSGWPLQTGTGWATAPYNEVVYWLSGAYKGTQYVSLQGWNGFSTASDPINRLISRSFLLDPGYYSVSYDYLSMVDFSASGVSGIYCTAAPPSGNLYPTLATLSGKPKYDPAMSVNVSTNILGVYMAHSQLISTPNVNATLGSQTTFTNPNGTVTTTPTVSPDSNNWFNHNASAVNPLIDTCGYSSSYAWVPRTVNVKITKPGIYWLTFSAQGDPLTVRGGGPAIDDVKLSALGSLYMTSPPSTVTTIPVPGPQPESKTYFNGFYIIANPLTPPAAVQ